MDIQITWDTANARGDWSLGTGDLALGIDIETAVLVSLFSDRIAAPGWTPPDGSGDRRGWWGDSYSDRPLGSRLWTLDRAKKVGQAPLLLQARDYCKEALAWLVEDGIAASVDVQTQWLSADALGIVVKVTEPRGSVLNPFRFSWAWGTRR